MEYKINDFSNYVAPYIHNFPEYKKIFEKRMIEFKQNYMDDFNVYFNEFFSYTPIPFECLMKINMILKKIKIDNIYDLCSGTGYHSYLFHNILGYNVESYDIQLDHFKNKWFKVKKNNCNDLLLNDKNPKLIILSWIESKQLLDNIIKNCRPEYIILIGQYFRCPYTYEVYNNLVENNELIKEFIINELDSKDNQKISIIKIT